MVGEACAVCHSDLSYVDGIWATDSPLVLGHEASGRVADGGDGVYDLSTNDPVVVSLVRTCGECRACRKGHEVACTGNLSLNNRSPLSDADGNRIPQGLNVAAFATQVVVHRSQVVRLPDGFDLVEASLLGCGVLTGSGAVTNTARVDRGDAVIVVGCGGVGVGAIQAARIAGAEPILAVDPEADKRKAALGFGATHTVDPVGDDVAAAIRSATGGRLAAHLVVPTGAPAGRRPQPPRRALACGPRPRRGGQLLPQGLPGPPPPGRTGRLRLPVPGQRHRGQPPAVRPHGGQGPPGRWR